ncbi:MAG: aldehyde dehydrogenase [Candidatus Thiodiazotropha sp.]
MSRQAFFLVLIAIIGGVIYVMRSSDNPPETRYNQTPNEYIELVEKKKAARMAVEKAIQQGEARNREALEPQLNADTEAGR